MRYLEKIGAKYWLLLVIISIPLLGYLGAFPIRLWDESRQAINAYEMYKNGNYIVTYFKGIPDMWNTKPPLLVWCQVVLMKLIGVNEWAIRLPSAFAGILTCTTIFSFSFYYLKNFWLGFLSVIVLVSSQGYIDEHVVRTGDFDALLTLFTTLMGVFAFIYVETKQSKYIYLFFSVSALAVLTKGIAGLLFLPGIFAFVVLQKGLITLLKNKHAYVALLFFLLIVLGYYMAREFFNEGYLQAVWDNELGGRYLAENEEHNGPFWFYLKDMFTRDFVLIYYVLIPIGGWLGLKSNDEKTKRFFLFSILITFLFLIVISFAKTKLRWYEVPVYPWFAFFIARAIEDEFRRLVVFFKNRKSIFFRSIPYLFLFFIMLIPYFRSLKRVFKITEHEWNIELYEVSYYLRDALINNVNLNNQFLLTEDDAYRPFEMFYVELLKDKGINISIESLEEMKEGQVVFTSIKETSDFVKENYLYTVLQSKGNVVTYKLHGKK